MLKPVSLRRSGLALGWPPLKPLKAWFSIETRLSLIPSGFKLLQQYFIGRSNIVSYSNNVVVAMTTVFQGVRLLK